jgi:hypothetical protein
MFFTEEEVTGEGPASLYLKSRRDYCIWSREGPMQITASLETPSACTADRAQNSDSQKAKSLGIMPRLFGSRTAKLSSRRRCSSCSGCRCGIVVVVGNRRCDYSDTQCDRSNCACAQPTHCPSGGSPCTRATATTGTCLPRWGLRQYLRGHEHSSNQNPCDFLQFRLPFIQLGTNGYGSRDHHL